MKFTKALAIGLCYTLAFTSLGSAASDVKFGMKYEGGSLNLDSHDKLNVTLRSDKILISQDQQAHAIPVKSITEVSYGNDVHRRVGTAVGVAIVTFGIGALIALTKTKKHYVGMLWDDKAASKGGVVLRWKGRVSRIHRGTRGNHRVKAVNADAPAGGAAGTSKP
jgi:hypothetical protein